MRQRLGLPPPERRIGLTAHDFAQAASAPDVVLVHCERRGGKSVNLRLRRLPGDVSPGGAVNMAHA